MSTNANISVQHEDGTVSTSYLHWDGYPSAALTTLAASYNSLALAESLVALGSLSVLADSAECPAGHSFEKPVKGYSIAYHRDRGEGWQHTRPIKADSINQIDRDQSYNYLFSDGKWSIN